MSFEFVNLTAIVLLKSRQIVFQHDIAMQAVVRLGLCYQNGLGGLEQSSKHAVDLFQVAALKRHPFANSALGRAYDRGEGYRWNPEKVSPNASPCEG